MAILFWATSALLLLLAYFFTAGYFTGKTIQHIPVASHRRDATTSYKWKTPLIPGLWFEWEVEQCTDPRQNKPHYVDLWIWLACSWNGLLLVDLVHTRLHEMPEEKQLNVYP